MARISTGISTRNPFGPDWGNSKAGQTKQTGVKEQVQDQLFGKAKPKVVDSDSAHLDAQMARLHVFKKRLALLAGDKEDDYDLTLAEGTIAMIDKNGLIYMGKEFVLEYMDFPDILIGVLAHEIGHRPKRWDEYKSEKKLNKAQMEEVCRLEETRADYFAGKALAVFKMSCEPLILFLKHVQKTPHPEYFSAELRAEVIKEGFEDSQRQVSNRKKFFPELAKMDNDLGSG